MMHLATLLASSTTSTTTAAAHKSGTSLLDPIAKPIAWVLALIYSVIPNYGVSIIALSIIWMAIISPLTLKSTRSMLAMQKLQPQLKKLQEQHKNDKQAFAQAQMDLFREHQVSPFGSCLPMLLPLPVFFALFRVLEGLGRTTPKYLSPNTRMYKDIVASHGNLYAFGMNLSKNAFSPHSSVWAALPYWILVVVMGVTGYLQSAQMMSRNPNAAQNPQMRMMKYLPLAFTVIFIRFPAGVLLYYATSNICRIVQQDLMYRFDPKVKALVAQEVIEVEELTEEIDQQQADRQRGVDAARRSLSRVRLLHRAGRRVGEVVSATSWPRPPNNRRNRHHRNRHHRSRPPPAHLEGRRRRGLRRRTARAPVAPAPTGRPAMRRLRTGKRAGVGRGHRPTASAERASRPRSRPLEDIKPIGSGGGDRGSTWNGLKQPVELCRKPRRPRWMSSASTRRTPSSTSWRSRAPDCSGASGVRLGSGPGSDRRRRELRTIGEIEGAGTGPTAPRPMPGPGQRTAHRRRLPSPSRRP